MHRGIRTSTSTTPVTSRLIFSTTTRNIADTSAGAASCLYVNEVGRRSHWGRGVSLQCTGEISITAIAIIAKIMFKGRL